MALQFLSVNQPSSHSVSRRLKLVSALGFVLPLLLVLISAVSLFAEESRQVLIRDIASIEGIRDNPLIGYGVVVGLKRTGDSQQTLFTTQTLANMLQRLGLQISASTIQVRNIAAVMVTSSLAAVRTARDNSGRHCFLNRRCKESRRWCVITHFAPRRRRPDLC